MAYADQQMSGNKVIAIIIVALIHVALGYALVTGLAMSAVKEIAERVTTVDIEEEEPPEPEEEPPPPEPQEQVTAPPQVVPPAPINIPRPTPPRDTTPDIPPPRDTNPLPPQGPLPLGDPPTQRSFRIG